MEINIFLEIWKLYFFRNMVNFFPYFGKNINFFGFKNIPYDSFWAACFLSFFFFYTKKCSYVNKLRVLYPFRTEGHSSKNVNCHIMSKCLFLYFEKNNFYISKKIHFQYFGKNMSQLTQATYFSRKYWNVFFRNIEKIFFRNITKTFRFKKCSELSPKK